jgi:hypothetical protein
MFGVSDDEKKYFVGRFQKLPREVLAQRFDDDGEMAAKYLRATLELWAMKHAQYSDTGKLLAKPADSINGLFGYLGLKETNKRVSQVQPWQVFDHYIASSNFELIYLLTIFPNLDDEGLIKDVRDNLGEAIFWATAISHMSDKADLKTMTSAYVDFTLASHRSSAMQHYEQLASVAPILLAYSRQKKKMSTFVRKPNPLKEQRLREATNAYRIKYPNRSRNAAANALSKYPNIDLGVTRIKEYFSLWFSPVQWPNEKAGRKPKPSE